MLTHLHALVAADTLPSMLFFLPNLTESYLLLDSGKVKLFFDSTISQVFLWLLNDSFIGLWYYILIIC